VRHPGARAGTLRRCLAAILAPQGYRVGSIGDSGSERRAQRRGLGTYRHAPALHPIAHGPLPAWGDRTTIVATPRSAWTWPTPSKTRKRAPPCCKWRRYGCAWHRGRSPRGNPIMRASESLSDWSPWQASPKPAPFPPRPGAAARSLPVAPNGGIPARSADIRLRVPCKSNRPAGAPFQTHSGPCRWSCPKERP
jgi:hypothetical protein